MCLVFNSETKIFANECCWLCFPGYRLLKTALFCLKVKYSDLILKAQTCRGSSTVLLAVLLPNMSPKLWAPPWAPSQSSMTLSRWSCQMFY